MTKPAEHEMISCHELLEAWPLLSHEDRRLGFQMLERPAAEELYLSLSAHDQADIVLSLPNAEQRSWMRLLAPDDAADLLQQVTPQERDQLLSHVDTATRKEVSALLAYEEDEAGGLMNPRYVRLRPDMTVDASLGYLRRQAKLHPESLFYVYVIDAEQKLQGVLSLRELFAAPSETYVRDIMRTEVITVNDEQDQESVSLLFQEHGLVAIPVVDRERKMMGIVTVDDIVEVVQEEATEDIQKFGGMEALDLPYLRISFFDMFKKRAGWLSVLFIGEMLTATAMSFFESEIAKAVVLALFIPLIISSGGNAGSQASTLVIRAMALEEIKLKDWWRVMKRELAAGLALGSTLATLGFIRILIWGQMSNSYGPHFVLIAASVALSLIGVVLFGTLAGSLLPFLFRSIKLDPASASAPFVATLVDVTGLIIYFGLASILLRGTLL